MRPDALFAGRYRLERRLGVGGMATVQLAFDTRLERNVAVKLLAEHLAEDANFVSRFRREALAAARLVHPNIVQVFDFGLDETTHRNFIVMEYVDGQSCAEMLREQATLAARRGGRDPRPGLPRARLRAPQRRRAPRRQARQPPAQRRGDGQARRLRHRQGRRGLGHHEGRLGARHRRLPGARAGARRGGRPVVGPLRARRRRLPAAGRPPALRRRLADRPGAAAGDRPAAAARRGRPGRSRRRWPPRSPARCIATPSTATPTPPRWRARCATACAAARRPRPTRRGHGRRDRRHADAHRHRRDRGGAAHVRDRAAPPAGAARRAAPAAPPAGPARCRAAAGQEEAAAAALRVVRGPARRARARRGRLRRLPGGQRLGVEERAAARGRPRPGRRAPSRSCAA